MAYPSKIRGKVTKAELEEMYFNRKMTFKQIADIYGCQWTSVQSYARQLGIEKKDICQVRAEHYDIKPVNENFFSEWGKETAYALGVIITDGHIEKTGELRISMKDVDVVEGIGRAMELQGGVSLSKGKNNKGQTVLRVLRKKLYEDLKRLGICMDNKTLNQPFPHIPKEFRSHFLRGLFDGDGCIVSRKRKTPNNVISRSREVTVITTSSLSMAEGVVQMLKEELGIQREVYHQIKKAEGRLDVYRVNIYNGPDIDKFREYIYQDKGYLYMKRKYLKFNLEEVA